MVSVQVGAFRRPVSAIRTRTSCIRNTANGSKGNGEGIARPTLCRVVKAATDCKEATCGFEFVRSRRTAVPAVRPEAGVLIGLTVVRVNGLVYRQSAAQHGRSSERPLF